MRQMPCGAGMILIEVATAPGDEDAAVTTRTKAMSVTLPLGSERIDCHDCPVAPTGHWRILPPTKSSKNLALLVPIAGVPVTGWRIGGRQLLSRHQLTSLARSGTMSLSLGSGMVK